jgi:hypothetical protein
VEKRGALGMVSEVGRDWRGWELVVEDIMKRGGLGMEEVGWKYGSW